MYEVFTRNLKYPLSRIFLLFYFFIYYALGTNIIYSLPFSWVPSVDAERKNGTGWMSKYEKVK